MKNFLSILAATILLLCAATSTNAQGWQWARDAATYDGNLATSVATDKFGNVYVAGKFFDSVNFGSIHIVSPSWTNIFLAKYDSLGNVKWVRPTKALPSDNLFIATDSSGNVYLTCQYDTTIMFGDITLHCPTTAICLVKYDTVGNVVWAKSSGNTNYVGDFLPTGIVTDRSSHVYVVGQFGYDTLVFTSSSGAVYTLHPKMFLIKYDSSGNLIWAKGETDTFETVYASSLAIDRFDHLYVSGQCFSMAVFDTIPFASLGQGMFLVRYDTAGHAKWAAGGGHATVYGFAVSNDYSTALATDGNGNVYVTGIYDSTVTFADSSFTMTGQQIFLAKYDSSGNAIWGRTTYGSGIGHSSGLTTDRAGNIYMTGTVLTSLQFGTIEVYDSNYQNVFLANYDSSGNVVWANIAFGSSSIYGSSCGAGVCVDLSGNIFVAGYFGGESSLRLGGVTMTCDSPYAAMFVAKYSNSYSVGIPDDASKGGFYLYPNPATDLLNLQNGSSSHWVADIAIYDMLGRMMLEYPTHGNRAQTIQIPLPMLADGMYILKAAGANGVECLRFVVKR